MSKNKSKMLLDGIVLLIFSLVLYNLGISAVLYLVPLLVFAAKYGKKKGTFLIIIGLVLCFLLEFVEHLSMDNGFYLSDLALALFIPVSLSAAGIIWLYTEKGKVVYRLLLSLLPSLIFVLACVVVFLADRALFNSVYMRYEDAFVVAFGPIFESFGLDIDLSWFFFLLLISIGSLLIPLVLTAVCANCFIYETVLHSRESDWEDRVCGLEFSPNMVWGFIISLALILLFYFVSAPIALEVIVVNIGFSFGVLYAIQGFAVLFSWLKRSMAKLKSMTLFIILFITSTVIPGINFIVLLGLPILGLLESFFDLKKIGEKKNEDYS